MPKVVLIRHGESEWNQKNLFTGWTDVDLNEHGIDQARKAGKKLQQEGFAFDVAYTSSLKRAIRTLWLVLGEMDRMWVRQTSCWRLNERHYGALQGLNKAETAAKYGDDQVHLWRRSYDIPPPPLEPGDERHPKNQPSYRGLPESVLPACESLADTYARVLPYWVDEIRPQVMAGKQVLIAAHGNTLRALVKHLDGLSGEEVAALEIPTGEPLVYELDDDLRPLRHYYLNSPEEIEGAIRQQQAAATAANNA